LFGSRKTQSSREIQMPSRAGTATNVMKRTRNGARKR
jgi:hypothetical protein